MGAMNLVAGFFFLSIFVDISECTFGLFRKGCHSCHGRFGMLGASATGEHILKNLYGSHYQGSIGPGSVLVGHGRPRPRPTQKFIGTQVLKTLQFNHILRLVYPNNTQFAPMLVTITITKMPRLVRESELSLKPTVHPAAAAMIQHNSIPIGPGVFPSWGGTVLRPPQFLSVFYRGKPIRAPILNVETDRGQTPDTKPLTGNDTWRTPSFNFLFTIVTPPDNKPVHPEMVEFRRVPSDMANRSPRLTTRPTCPDSCYKIPYTINDHIPKPGTAIKYSNIQIHPPGDYLEVKDPNGNVFQPIDINFIVRDIKREGERRRETTHVFNKDFMVYRPGKKPAKPHAIVITATLPRPFDEEDAKLVASGPPGVSYLINHDGPLNGDVIVHATGQVYPTGLFLWLFYDDEEVEDKVILDLQVTFEDDNDGDGTRTLIIRTHLPFFSVLLPGATEPVQPTSGTIIGPLPNNPSESLIFFKVVPRSDTPVSFTINSGPVPEKAVINYKSNRVYPHPNDLELHYNGKKVPDVVVDLDVPSTNRVGETKTVTVTTYNAIFEIVTPSGFRTNPLAVQVSGVPSNVDDDDIRFKLSTSPTDTVLRVTDKPPRGHQIFFNGEQLFPVTGAYLAVFGSSSTPLQGTTVNFVIRQGRDDTNGTGNGGSNSENRIPGWMLMVSITIITPKGTFKPDNVSVSGNGQSFPLGAIYIVVDKDPRHPAFILINGRPMENGVYLLVNSVAVPPHFLHVYYENKPVPGAVINIIANGDDDDTAEIRVPHNLMFTYITVVTESRRQKPTDIDFNNLPEYVDPKQIVIIVNRNPNKAAPIYVNSHPLPENYVVLVLRASCPPYFFHVTYQNRELSGVSVNIMINKRFVASLVEVPLHELINVLKVVSPSGPLILHNVVLKDLPRDVQPHLCFIVVDRSPELPARIFFNDEPIPKEYKVSIQGVLIPPNYAHVYYNGKPVPGAIINIIGKKEEQPKGNNIQIPYNEFILVVFTMTASGRQTPQTITIKVLPPGVRLEDLIFIVDSNPHASVVIHVNGKPKPACYVVIVRGIVCPPHFIHVIYQGKTLEGIILDFVVELPESNSPGVSQGTSTVISNRFKEMMTIKEMGTQTTPYSIKEVQFHVSDRRLPQDLDYFSINLCSTFTRPDQAELTINSGPPNNYIVTVYGITLDPPAPGLCVTYNDMTVKNITVNVNVEPDMSLQAAGNVGNEESYSGSETSGFEKA